VRPEHTLYLAILHVPIVPQELTHLLEQRPVLTVQWELILQVAPRLVLYVTQVKGLILEMPFVLTAKPGLTLH
jgi:hypothetical protein